MTQRGDNRDIAHKVIDGEVIAEFHAQNSTEYFMKDVVTIMPGVLYAMACLGQNPVECYERIDIEFPRVRAVAEKIQDLVHSQA